MLLGRIVRKSSNLPPGTPVEGLKGPWLDAFLTIAGLSHFRGITYAQRPSGTPSAVAGTAARLEAPRALLERREHRGGRGAYAAPRAECLRGLLDQHAEALQRLRAAVRARPADEGGRRAAVGEVVAHRGGPDHRAGHRRHLAREARGGRVDDEIEGLGADVPEAHALRGAEVGESG